MYDWNIIVWSLCTDTFAQHFRCQFPLSLCFYIFFIFDSIYSFARFFCLTLSSNSGAISSIWFCWWCVSVVVDTHWVCTITSHHHQPRQMIEKWMTMVSTDSRSALFTHSTHERTRRVSHCSYAYYTAQQYSSTLSQQHIWLYYCSSVSFLPYIVVVDSVSSSWVFPHLFFFSSIFSLVPNPAHTPKIVQLARANSHSHSSYIINKNTSTHKTYNRTSTADIFDDATAIACFYITNTSSVNININRQNCAP